MHNDNIMQIIKRDHTRRYYLGQYVAGTCLTVHTITWCILRRMDARKRLIENLSLLKSIVTMVDLASQHAYAYIDDAATLDHPNAPQLLNPMNVYALLYSILALISWIDLSDV